MSKIYQIEVKEVLARLVTVKADSMNDALDAVEKLYNKSSIVLDAEDLVDEASFECEDEWPDDGHATYDAKEILSKE